MHVFMQLQSRVTSDELCVARGFWKTGRNLSFATLSEGEPARLCPHQFFGCFDSADGPELGEDLGKVLNHGCQWSMFFKLHERYKTMYF